MPSRRHACVPEFFLGHVEDGVGGERRDDPCALRQLALELTRSPARVAEEETGAAPAWTARRGAARRANRRSRGLRRSAWTRADRRCRCRPLRPSRCWAARDRPSSRATRGRPAIRRRASRTDPPQRDRSCGSARDRRCRPRRGARAARRCGGSSDRRDRAARSAATERATRTRAKVAAGPTPRPRSQRSPIPSRAPCSASTRSSARSPSRAAFHSSWSFTNFVLARFSLGSADALAVDALGAAASLTLLAMAAAALGREPIARRLGLGAGRLPRVSVASARSASLVSPTRPRRWCSGAERRVPDSRASMTHSRGRRRRSSASRSSRSRSARRAARSCSSAACCSADSPPCSGRSAAIALASVAFGAAHGDLVHGVAAALLGLYLGVLTDAADSVRAGDRSPTPRTTRWRCFGVTAQLRIPRGRWRRRSRSRPA